MGYAARYVGIDIPAAVLDHFEIETGTVFWRAGAKKRSPARRLAGGRLVMGRGALVLCNHVTLLTADIRDAIEHGGDWPWTRGAALPSVPASETELAAWRALIVERFALDRERLVWRIDRGPRGAAPLFRAGSSVTGLQMSGFRCALAQTGGVGVLIDDAVTFLKTNVFPFEWD